MIIANLALHAPLAIYRGIISVKYTLPPCLAYKLPPMNPFTGAVAAYTNIVVLRMEPRLYINRKESILKYMNNKFYTILLD